MFLGIQMQDIATASMVLASLSVAVIAICCAIAVRSDIKFNRAMHEESKD